MNGRDSVINFLHGHAASLMLRTAEHLQLTGITIILAFALGVTLAVLAYRRPGLHVPLIAVTGMLQTIPGMALLVMMMAIFQRIGSVPALSALVLYALLPIVQNTLVGLQSLSPVLAEAARGLGLSRGQRLRYIRLPLALPMIMAGLRIAAVQTVGLATLAAFIGAGGLGQFINRGLFLSDTRLILLGAIPSALLALLIHGILSILGMAAVPTRARAQRRALIATAFIALVALAAFATIYGAPPVARNSITIGSKNFTEQLIVAEMIAQHVEQNSSLPVVRRFGLGGSTVLHEALTNGSIDLAVEYTGTALSAILHQPSPANATDVFPLVRDTYAERYQLTWLPPLGFNNSYLLAIRDDDLQLRSIRTISDLARIAPTLGAAFDFEFAEREDGYRGLKQHYGLRFRNVTDMHPDLLYTALLNRTTDVISAYATDGRLAQPGLRTVTDDQHFFPPYDAAIVVRASTLRAHPELKATLEALSNSLDNDRMRQLNAAVDRKELSIEEAAAQALQR